MSVEKHFVYDGYGNITSEYSAAGTTVESLFLYTGRMFDEATGLQNNLYRWYDPATGTWIGTDPIGFAGDASNLYRYCNNSPLNWIDPTGLWPWNSATYSGGVCVYVDYYDTVGPTGPTFSGATDEKFTIPPELKVDLNPNLGRNPANNPDEIIYFGPISESDIGLVPTPKQEKDSDQPPKKTTQPPKLTTQPPKEEEIPEELRPGIGTKIGRGIGNIFKWGLNVVMATTNEITRMSNYGHDVFDEPYEYTPLDKPLPPTPTIIGWDPWEYEGSEGLDNNAIGSTLQGDASQWKQHVYYSDKTEGTIRDWGSSGPGGKLPCPPDYNQGRKDPDTGEWILPGPGYRPITLRPSLTPHDSLDSPPMLSPVNRPDYGSGSSPRPMSPNKTWGMPGVKR